MLKGQQHPDEPPCLSHHIQNIVRDTVREIFNALFLSAVSRSAPQADKHIRLTSTMWYNGAGGDFLTHLLVVDDEVSILELIKNSLRKGQILYQAQMKVCCDAPFFLCVNVPRHGREAPEYEKVS